MSFSSTKYDSVFEQLNGSDATKVSGGSNGSSTTIFGVFTQENNRSWVRSNNTNNEFTVEKESIVWGFSKSSNTGNDFYHLYKITGSNLGGSYSGKSIGENADAAILDEDTFAVCNSGGSFNMTLTGKYNGGYFCGEDSRITIIRNK